MDIRYVALFSAGLLLSGLLPKDSLAVTSPRFDIGPGESVAFLTLGGETLLTVNRGHVSHLTLQGQAHGELLEADVSHFNLNEDASASIIGGDYSFINVRERSSVHLSKVADISWLLFEGNDSSADIVVREASYGRGHLRGLWEDGSPFEFWALKSARLSSGEFGPRSVMPQGINLIFVPEPSAFLLASLVSMFIIAKPLRK